MSSACEDKNGRQAEGFVSVASFADITRRAGVIGRRLFAVLAGTETPEDVAAIMSWFYEDPQRLGETRTRGDQRGTRTIRALPMTRLPWSPSRSWSSATRMILPAKSTSQERPQTEIGPAS